MSDTLDYEGHYKALGIPPTASADEVKRAFRNLARDLHPDRNPGKDTTAAFQRISSAYEVLKDTKKRADYNAEGARRMRDAQASPGQSSTAPQTSTARSSSSARTTAQSGFSRHQAELRMCASCGCLSAQPRITYFMAVRGLISVAKTIRKGGVYCPRCAMRTGLTTNLVNWLIGWWALPMGPPRTIEATFTNLAGGYKPMADNVILLYRQALGFHFAGHSKIALGIVEDALRMSPSLDMRDKLLTLRQHIGAGRPGPRLRNEWQLAGNPIFWAQLIPVVVVFVLMLQLVLSFVRVEFIDFSNITRPITSQFDQLLDPKTQDAANDTIPFRVVVDRLPVYAAPNTSAERLGQLLIGAEVPVLPEDAIGGWEAVRLPDGTVGYTAKSGLQPIVE